MGRLGGVVMDVVKNILKVVDGGGELRIMRHSFAGVEQAFSEAWSGLFLGLRFSC